MSTKNNLSHKDAILEVYKYTPQIKDYDKFMHIGARWLPYTMYFHEKNFKSPTINTDNLGFRYSILNKQRYSIAELPNDDRKINLLVGGSTALGVGSTADDYTVASFLSDKSGEIWLNFAGRGYNSVQECLLFLMHKNKLNNIGKVVILSGINTLALEGIPDSLASDNGRYYYSFEFQHYMNKYNEDMKRNKRSFMVDKPKWNLQTIKTKINSFLENPADIIISDRDTDLKARIIRAAKSITDELYNWKLLLSDKNVELNFILQPLAYWTREYLTDEEKAVFNAIDQCPNNFYRLFSKVLGKEIHPLFYEEILKGAQDKSINCFDMNEMLRKTDKISETLFVDRVHFNDLGNEILSELIFKKIYR